MIIKENYQESYSLLFFWALKDLLFRLECTMD